MKIFEILIIVKLVDCLKNSSVFNPTDYYADFTDLVDEIYRIYWNTTDKDLIAEIHCLTNSWVGFGISPNGKMNKSNVLIGWLNQMELYIFLF